MLLSLGGACQEMSAEVKKEIELEIAHVLFINIVGYSKLLINEQQASLDTLNRIVRDTEQFRARGFDICSPSRRAGTCP